MVGETVICSEQLLRVLWASKASLEALTEAKMIRNSAQVKQFIETSATLAILSEKLKDIIPVLAFVADFSS